MSRQGGVYTDRGVGMGHCQGGVYNRERGQDGKLSGRCIQQTEVSGWATVREVYTTERRVRMGRCQGGVYNGQRGRDGPLSVVHTTDRGVRFDHC